MDFSKLLNDRQLKPFQTHRNSFASSLAPERAKPAYYVSNCLFNFGMACGTEPDFGHTFTNKWRGKCAKGDQFGAHAREKLRVLTFHSFCARFLRREITAIGYPSSFTIFDDDRPNPTVKAIAVEEGYRKNDDIVKQTLNFIASHKCFGFIQTTSPLPRNGFPKNGNACAFMAFMNARCEPCTPWISTTCF
jgi:hypothetical protein